MLNVRVAVKIFGFIKIIDISDSRARSAFAYNVGADMPFRAVDRVVIGRDVIRKRGFNLAV